MFKFNTNLRRLASKRDDGQSYALGGGGLGLVILIVVLVLILR